MSNIFASLRTYAGRWTEKAKRAFSAEEKDAVASASVVESNNYGLSACFIMKSGGMTFIPMSKDSTLGVGESIDLEKAELITLEKSGEADIHRVRA